jgi:hypothetical protein
VFKWKNYGVQALNEAFIEQFNGTSVLIRITAHPMFEESICTLNTIDKIKLNMWCISTYTVEGTHCYLFYRDRQYQQVARSGLFSS